MAVSFSVTTLQVDFEYVLAMEHSSMVWMFKTLENTGLKSFLTATGSVYEVLGNRGGSGSRLPIRQSGPRPEGRLLRQPAVEGLTRSVQMDSPRRVGRSNSGEGRRRRRRLRDTASRGPTTIVAPESQFRTCPMDHDNIGYPRMSASGESSTTKHRLLHASGPHPIPPPNDPNLWVTNRGNGWVLNILKETVIEMRNRFSRSDVSFRATSKKKEMKMEFRLLHDIVAKARSFDMVTSEKFELMVAISVGLKVNWAQIIFNTLLTMLTNPKNNLKVTPSGESSKKTEDTASNTEGDEIVSNDAQGEQEKSSVDSLATPEGETTEIADWVDKEDRVERDENGIQFEKEADTNDRALVMQPGSEQPAHQIITYTGPNPVEEHCQMVLNSAWEAVSNTLADFDEWIRFRTAVKLRDVSSFKDLTQIEDKFLVLAETEEEQHPNQPQLLALAFATHSEQEQTAAQQKTLMAEQVEEVVKIVETVEEQEPEKEHLVQSTEHQAHVASDLQQACGDSTSDSSGPFSFHSGESASMRYYHDPDPNLSESPTLSGSYTVHHENRVETFGTVSNLEANHMECQDPNSSTLQVAVYNVSSKADENQNKAEPISQASSEPIHLRILQFTETTTKELTSLIAEVSSLTLQANHTQHDTYVSKKNMVLMRRQLDTRVDGLDAKIDGLDAKFDALETNMVRNYADSQQQIVDELALVKSQLECVRMFGDAKKGEGGQSSSRPGDGSGRHGKVQAVQEEKD
ncbi:hypothetical protein F511_22985 [Dorcoceras hygrometricum]|uniref:Uncharacterized protein n=1 Tax=Dorcoceras hygrometricum TaxID=472368 RepID=A0A2Z7AL53_9LAMI|nr:hypothetical protein F511_22985 [Dorcoceras hygrometricum]